MNTTSDERIAVVAGATSFGVTLTIGETLVTIRTPRTTGDADLTDEQVRSAALRNARRALEVALEEVGIAIG